MAAEIRLDELRVRAARAGLALNEDELEQLTAGVSRAFKQVDELRALIAEKHEPASIFSAAGRKTE